MKVPVLLFHDVSPDAAGKAPGITIAPERFREIIAWLAAHGYTGISARDWLNAQNRKGTLPEKPIVITFDDAYASITDYALPILQSHGFRATVFVVSGLIGGASEWDAHTWRPLPLMDAEQIRAWAASGIEFGSHSRNHCDLTTLTESDLLRETATSQDELASIVGSPIMSFAYPYGSHNKAIRQIVSQKYSLAFTVVKGVVTPDIDPMLCCRIEVLPNYSPLRVGLYLRLASSARLLRSIRLVRPLLLPRFRTVQR
ncbi:MAG: polysaccharide deacetylase family protein [Candidatus Korobacteraceae bacterium]